MHYPSCCIWASILWVVSEANLTRFLHNYDLKSYHGCHGRGFPWLYRTWKDMYEINITYIFWDRVTCRCLYVYLIILTLKVLLLFFPSVDGLLIWPIMSFHTAGQKRPTDLDLDNLSSKTTCGMKPYIWVHRSLVYSRKTVCNKYEFHIFSDVLRINKYNQLQISSIYVPYFSCSSWKHHI